VTEKKSSGKDSGEPATDDSGKPRKTLKAASPRDESTEPGRRHGLRTRFRPGGLKPVRGARAAEEDPDNDQASEAPAAEAPARAREPDRLARDKRSPGSHRERRASGEQRITEPRHADSRPPGRDRPEKPAKADSLEDPRGIRLSKLMAERGLCSRREADWIIERGWVFVDGRRISELGVRVSRDVAIELAPEAARRQAERVTILLHKPVGYVSGQAEDGHEPAVVLVGPDNQFDREEAQRFHRSHLRGLAPAGRLDIDSTGLLVLTQDGRVARTLIGEDSKVEKEYLVRVEGELDAEGLALLNHGLELDGRKLRQAKVERINEDQLRFVLREGRKRQIRRMCELVGLRVTGLKRVRIGKVKLGDLPLGEWRFLRAEESF
jgi:23S rRNA pseudouridine2604 synthase